eukprot:CAMPEP_0115241282 /NCGR_PEP_ID=MMETSP0270-20121206/38346_1 /TAXON_ID=71861 /ORGANISM="Scrippsiella trochoidea, Strain CCMP3099" /LENGTH=476 /DNA_ID=CAMNT_0002656291 /DNA_START=121 /DNA_END=1551 /DNA_ORIENTATION=+
MPPASRSSASLPAKSTSETLIQLDERVGRVRSFTCPDMFRPGSKEVKSEDVLASISTDDDDEDGLTPPDSPRKAEGSRRPTLQDHAYGVTKTGGDRACDKSPAAVEVGFPTSCDGGAAEPVEECLTLGAVPRRVRLSSEPEQLEPQPHAELEEDEEVHEEEEMRCPPPPRTATQRGRICFAARLKVSTPSSMASPVQGYPSSPTVPSRTWSDDSAKLLVPSLGESNDDARGPCVLPGVATRKVRMNLPPCEDDSPPVQEAVPCGSRRLQSLKLATPSSCTSAVHRYAFTPTTPDPLRAGFRFVNEELDVVFFDFDGTLTATPGSVAMQMQRWEKKEELKGRAAMLRPRLEALREAGLTLGIMSKSTEQTIRDALQAAGLEEFFNGPIVGKALGFEGKAGIIDDMHKTGKLPLGPEGLARVLLIDDDVRELDRAREHGIQTFAAPEDGGLQESDFDEIFVNLSLPSLPGSMESTPTA